MKHTAARLAMTLALITSACGLLPGSAPQGAAGDVARQVAAVLAPNADITDQPFDDFLAKLDLQKTHGAKATEILEQIRKTRAAVAAARASSSAHSGSRMASVNGVVGTFSIPYFATFFASLLDGLTKRSGTVTRPSQPYTSQETGATSFTTTNLNVSETYTGTGSRAAGTVKWTYNTITIETATGATLVHITDERTLEGAIDVCPDAGGFVPGSLNVTSAFSAQSGGVTTTRNSTGTSTFKGSVDDNAGLRSVSQESRHEATGESANGSGGYNSSQSATWNAGANGFLSGLAAGSMSASLTPTGSLSYADAARAAGWDMALDAYALEAAYQKAQDLWRHGRCVMVTAPGYGAETSIDIDEQEKSQHEENVDTASETKYAVQLKHRFGGGGLQQPTKAAMTSGDKKLEPSTLEGSGGQLTYTAGDEPDKTATVRMQSTSKRGIGTLVLTFRTGDSNLTLSVNGSMTLTAPFVNWSGTMKIGPIQLRKEPGAGYVGNGRSHLDMSTNVLGCVLSFVADGNVSVTATVEKRGDANVWVVKADPGRSGPEDMQGGTCMGASSIVPAPVGGGYGTIFMETAGDIVIPKDGGSVHVSGSRAISTATTTIDGTVTGTVERRR